MNNKSNASADELAEIFVELTDDLAYAQTNYPDSKVTLYLNDLTADIYRYIYKNKKDNRSRLITFWTEEVPLAFFRARKEAFVTLAFFSVCVLVGALASGQSEEFPRLVLGDGYVDMTLDNIERGEPAAVYSNRAEDTMFLGIAMNNLRVSLLTYMCGIFFTLGTFYFLAVNGLMLGAFQWFFIAKGVFLESFLAIWIHGTIEISCIVIAGTAGIVMGSGFLYPGTHSRMKSFQVGAKRSVKIFFGIIPLIILAAFLESYITMPRNYELHVIARVIVISLSAIFVLWYFVIHPMRLTRKRYGPEVFSKNQEFAVYGALIAIIGFVFFTLGYFAFESPIGFIGIGAILAGGGMMYVSVVRKKKTETQITSSV